jgi:ABC-type polysaccharide/polyol phosphate transport system ATPase subunit
VNAPAAIQTLPAPPDEAATTPRAGDNLAISLRDVSKRYEIHRRPLHRILDLLRIGAPRWEPFWALRGVYLDIPRGSTVGIIGENGAGKSTLLKIVSGVTQPTTGSVRVRGRLTSLIELGAGFHPEFSGRDNIRLACSILGLEQDEIAERTGPIIEFSELGDFIDRPVKTYSSGMYVRLGFAVATSVDPDILLIDEALAVGDEHFKGKCMRRLNEYAEAGGTTVFVSHDMGAVRSMCRHVVLLDRGEVVEQGAPERVADEYLKRVKARGDAALSVSARADAEYPRWGSGEIEVERVELLDDRGRPARVLKSGEPCRVRISYRVHAPVGAPVFGLGFYRSDGTYVNGSNHHWRASPIDLVDVRAGERGEVEMALERLPLLQGSYYLSSFLYDHGRPTPVAIDHREHVVAFQVVDHRQREHGLVAFPSTWTVRRRPPEGAPRDLHSAE